MDKGYLLKTGSLFAEKDFWGETSAIKKIYEFSLVVKKNLDHTLEMYEFSLVGSLKDFLIVKKNLDHTHPSSDNRQTIEDFHIRFDFFFFFYQCICHSWLTLFVFTSLMTYHIFLLKKQGVICIVNEK